MLKLHKAGRSLRWIAEETSLGFSTVRTIVDKGSGADRTTRKHRERVERIETTGRRRFGGSGRSAPGTPCPSKRSARSRMVGRC